MNKQILVIDDSESLTWLLGKILSKEYTVVRKNDGLEAMYWLTDGHLPDLIITDLNMPNLNGLDLVANLKKSGIFRDIPIVILSGVDDQAGKAKCKEYGAVDFLEKPFNPGQFMETVKKALQDQTLQLAETESA